MKAVAVLSKLTNGTGNRTTAERICFYLKEDFIVHLLDTTILESTEEFNYFIRKNEIQAVLGIHLVHAGKLLIECPVPYALIFGGTDLNVSRDSIELALMNKVAANAKYLISFNDVMKAMAEKLWTKCLDLEKIIIQHQGIVMAENIDYGYEDLFTEFSMEQPFPAFKQKHVFIMVGGIRPVKDVLYLVDVMKEWHLKDNRVYLVVVGPELDREYTRLCKITFKNSNNLFIFPALVKSKVIALMKRSFALLNSSVSEGMASAILEAMYLQVPVIARRNDGNAALIRHLNTGLLYDTAEDFKKHASMLTTSANVRQELVKNAFHYLQQRHDWKTERTGYLTLMRNITS